MSVPAVGGILLSTDQPVALKASYGGAFGASENDMGALLFGNVQLFIESHSEVEGHTKEPRASCSI